MRDQDSEHLFQTCHLRMQVRRERVTFLVLRVGQRRILLEQRRDAFDAVAPDGIEDRGEREQVFDDDVLLVVERPSRSESSDR